MENKILYNKKKKYPLTTLNSRQNSGEKQITRIMSLKHNKMVNNSNNPNSAGGNIKQNIKPSVIKANTNTNSSNSSNNNILNFEGKKQHHFLIPNANINIDGKIIKKHGNKIVLNNIINKNENNDPQKILYDSNNIVNNNNDNINKCKKKVILNKNNTNNYFSNNIPWQNNNNFKDGGKNSKNYPVDGNSIEEIKTKNMLISRKIMTATNSPSHSIQLISNTSNNNTKANASSKNNKTIKPKKNTTGSDIVYTKPYNRDILNSNENIDNFANKQQTSEKNTISTNNSIKNSSNNTNIINNNTTGKMKKNNEKIINKNKIHNYINNNIINDEQMKFNNMRPNNNEMMYNPHNTLKSNMDSVSMENDGSSCKNNNNVDNNDKKEHKKIIINDCGMIKKNPKMKDFKKNIINYVMSNNKNQVNNEFSSNEPLPNDYEKYINKQKDKIKGKKMTDKITEKLISEKYNNINTNSTASSNKNSIQINQMNNNNNKFIEKEKIEQLLLKKEKENIPKKNITNKINIKKGISKAKKSLHNRNMEQNFVMSSGANTSLLSTLKDSNYYKHECEQLSKYIKEYYNQHSCYPPTDISFYKYGRIIGKGAFGKVNIGLNILTGRVVAIKSFNKKNIVSENAKKKIVYETNLMRGCCHPSVTKILETFESEKYMLIIMEYISGGNLQSFVKKRRKLCEKTAKILFRQIIEGIKYIHSRGIVHRDIKLENILIDLNNIIKICDFGVGKLIKPGILLKDQCGTPVYMAPEILKGEGYQGPPVDIWSAGVALYIMLSGTLPFNKDKEHDLEYAILNNNYKNINDISEIANDLLKKILEKDPNKRYTCNQILEHPWMSSNMDEDIEYEIKNVNKYHLFTNAESILLAKTHIDYRNAAKKDLIENFTIKNLYTVDAANKKDVDTKSYILSPYNSMLTEFDEENKNKSKRNSYINEFDKLDNSNNELMIKNGVIKFHGKAKEFNLNYELNNNEEIDNGMLINSKNELVSKDSDNNNDLEKNIYLVKEDNNNKNISNRKKTKHRPSSPYRTPPINRYFVQMVADLGYGEDYVVKCLEENELNHATAVYYLFSNYENIK